MRELIPILSTTRFPSLFISFFQLLFCTFSDGTLYFDGPECVQMKFGMFGNDISVLQYVVAVLVLQCSVLRYLCFSILLDIQQLWLFSAKMGNSITMNLKAIGCKYVDWMVVVINSVQLSPVVNMIMNLLVS